MRGFCALSRFIPTPVGNTIIEPTRSRENAVHPHARGEHDCKALFNAMERGSSPRPWGTPSHRIKRNVFFRFIPTPVGNTLTVGCIVSCTGGSSPRPWGTHHVAYRMPDARRFIPTPVGNTYTRQNRTRYDTVHPHARGEHDVRRVRYYPKTGSSPRPWGTRKLTRAVTNTTRFIPTPVGNTRRNTVVICGGSVHPHARGEHSAYRVGKVAECGSSPRPWGTLGNNA